ncbi:MAG: shikimate kinase [Chthoniobacterales bacterium]
MRREEAIVLIGFMGAGKTSVGRELARLTEWPLFDTDDMIAANFGSSVAQVFETRGEEEFREAESRVLTRMPTRRAIVATGGGIVMRAENVSLLKRLGTVVYLEARESTLFERVSSEETRPLLKTDDPRATLSRLLAQRAPLYQAAADFTVHTNELRAPEVAEAIIQHVG